MDSHFIAIPFPPKIKARLASFCYGLPHVSWVDEENFHLILRSLGPLPDSVVSEIQDRLRTLFFHSFSLNLRGIDHSHSKGNRGIIWVGVDENQELLKLKKEIYKQLQGISLPNEEHTAYKHVNLGYYERLNAEKLGEYLFANGNFCSEAFRVEACLLLRGHKTSKRFYYETIDSFPASPPLTSDD